MNELEKARNKIDGIDVQTAQLFEKRMKCAAEIAEYKRKNALSVTDDSREKSILEKRLNGYVDNETRKFYGKYLLDTINISKKYQRTLLCGKNEVFVSTGESGYTVTVKRGAIGELSKYVYAPGKKVIVTDDGVPLEYIETCRRSLGGCGVVTLPNGEINKNINNLARIFDYLYDNSFSRTDSIVALGGGVVSDTAGFAAATYNRGLSFYNVPTTLLAQVDASVGGKVGIDHRGGKNLLGAFYDPKAVIIDPETLKTLGKRQISNGMAEIIKIAATCDKDLFDLIKSGKQYDVSDEVILRAVRIKAEIVENDPKESSLRRVLNFGHTIGHAIESSCGLGTLLHGECVALGMLPMCAESVRNELAGVLKDNGLPVACDTDAGILKDYIIKDKKKTGENITLVYVPEIGKYELKETPLNVFVDSLDELMKVIRRQK